MGRAKNIIEMITDKYESSNGFHSIADIKKALKKQVDLKNINSQQMNNIVSSLGSGDQFEEEDIKDAVRSHVDSGSTKDIIFSSIFST